MPLPRTAPINWDAIDTSSNLPFAVDESGSVVGFDPLIDPHLLLVGSSGSGKSVILQSLIYAAIVQNYDVYIADTIKGASDFRFAIPYAMAVAQEVDEASQIVSAVYKELVRRKELLSQEGTSALKGSNRILVVVDGLSRNEVVPMITNDPDLEFERERIISQNRRRFSVVSNTARLIREGRSAGIVVAVATQSVDHYLFSNLGGDIKMNTSRVITGNVSQGTRMSVLRDHFAAPTIGNDPVGRALVELGSAPAVLVQAWYDSSDPAALMGRLNERRDPLDHSKKLTLGPINPITTTTPAKSRIVDISSAKFSLSDFESAVAASNHDGVRIMSSSPVEVRHQPLALNELVSLCREINCHKRNQAGITKEMTATFYELNHTHPYYLRCLYDALPLGEENGVEFMNLIRSFSDNLGDPSNRVPSRNLVIISIYLTVDRLSSEDASLVPGDVMVRSWEAMYLLETLGEGVIYGEDEVRTALLLLQVVKYEDVRVGDLRHALGDAELFAKCARVLNEDISYSPTMSNAKEIRWMLFGDENEDGSYTRVNPLFLDIYLTVYGMTGRLRAEDDEFSTRKYAQSVWSMFSARGSEKFTENEVSGAVIITHAAEEKRGNISSKDIEFFAPRLEEVFYLLPELKARGGYDMEVIRNLLSNPATAMRAGEL